MYIQSVKAWIDVGYLEESLSVPFQKQLNLQYTWKVENVHPSPSALFSLLKLLIDGKDGRTLDNYLNTKYLEIKIDDFEYPIYGWVDDVVISSKRTVGIFWHIDCWRTYFHKCQYKGWVKRRSPSLTDPYHIFPAFSNHGCLEDIVLANQRKGIAWVILVYLEGDSLYGAATQAGLNSLPGAAEVKTVARTAIDAIKGLFNSLVAYSKTGRQYSSEDGNIGASLFFMPDFDVVRCLTFPISVNASEQLYFKSFDQYGSNDSPTYVEVINGTLSRTLGIKPGNLISCHVSPMCPLRDAGDFYDDGTNSDRPLILARQDSNIVVPVFESQRQKIITTSSRGNIGYVKIEGFGLRNIGKVSEGCIELKKILETYYTGHYLIDSLKYVDNNETYNVKISKTYFKYNGYMLMSLRQLLNLTYPGWNQYHDLNIKRLVWRQDGKYKSRLFQILPVPKKISDLPTWQLKQEGNDYTWFIELGKDQYFSDLCCNKEETYNIQRIDISHDVARVYDNEGLIFHANVVHSTMLDSIYVGVYQGDDWPDENFNFEGLEINAFDVAGDYILHMFRSLNSWGGRGAIQSKTMTWPILKGRLDREYYTDDYHDLVLIGPNGNVLHKFKTGVRISNYSYQTVTSGSSSFIKLRFETNNPYAMASECEVNVPLSTMTAFCEYSNPLKYLTEDSQRFVRYMIEDEKISKGIDLENDNIALGYKKQDEGLMNTLSRAAKDVASDAVKVTANAVGKISQDPIKYTPLGSVIGPAVDAIGNAINGGKSGSSGGSSMSDLARKLLSVPIAKYEPAHNVAQAIVEGPAFPTPQTYRDDEKALRKAQRDYEKDFREIERSIGGYNIDPSATACLSIGDMSWIHELGLLRLVYITKDDYSVDVYHNTSEMLGIDVNEYHGDYTIIQPGPLKVDPVRVLGKDVPKYALDYIKSRLEAGVYVDEKL